jgi:glycosyltransferase involved in cell wall biosynthesis
MKIALVSSIFDQNIPGGGTTLSLSLVEKWLSQGNEVTVFCVNSPSRNLSQLSKYIEQQKLKLFPLLSLEETIFGHQKNGGVFESVQQFLIKNRFDIVHIHNFHGLLSAVSAFQKNNVPSIYLALDFGLRCPTWYLFEKNQKQCSGPEKLKCKKCLAITHELGSRNVFSSALKLIKAIAQKYEVRKNLRFFLPSFRKRIVNAAESLDFMEEILRNFDSVLLPSPATSEVLKNQIRCKTHTVHFPVSSNRIAKEPKESRAGKPIRLLYLGHGHQIKGWDFFLSVLETLPDNLNLEVIDGGGSKAAFLSAPQKVKRYLKKSTKILSNELAHEIKSSDAILVPSLWHENTPLVVLESLANQTPVIASDQLGISHVVQHKKNGFLLAPGDHTAWRKFLIDICRSPHQLRSLSDIDYKITMEDFLQEIEAAQLEALKDSKKCIQ